MSDLNLESELFEKIVWTLIRRPQLNRLEFQRPVQVAKAETEKKGASVQVQLVQLVQMIGRDEHNNKIEFAVKHTPGGDCPEEGDELHVSWEIMTQGSHPVPYFSLQDIGTWSNWELVLRIGLKVLWKSVKTNMWHCKYLQSPPGTKTMDKRRSGALANYAWGAAIYAYLMRSTWPEVQSFVPRMGLAHVVEVRLNHFEQHVVCTPIPEPLAKLEGPRYQFRFTVARAKELRGTEGDVTQRLQNVDASWQSLDFEWARGKLSGADLEIAKTRTHCDHCWLQWNSPIGYGGPPSCERMKDKDGNETNRCRECFLKGIPCSWTREDHLGGPGHLTKIPGRTGQGSRDLGGEFHNLLMKSLVTQPEQTKATETVPIPDPEFMKTSEMDQGTRGEPGGLEIEEVAVGGWMRGHWK